MSDEIYHGGNDELEFQPPTPQQLGRIHMLASEVLDGTLTVAGRRHTISTTYFEAEFFQQLLASYNHNDATIMFLDDETVEKFLRTPGQPLAGLPKNARNSRVGVALGLASSIEYDGGFLEISAPLNGNGISYDVRPDTLIKEGTSTFFQQLEKMPQEATADQAETLLNIVRLLVLLNETGSPAPLEQQAAVQIREEFAAFDIEDHEETAPNPATLATIKTQLFNALDERSMRATFMRRFEGLDGIANMVSLKLKIDQAGEYSTQYEVQTRAPTAIDGSDFYVTSLKLDDDGGRVHSEYFDIDLNEAIKRKEAENPDFDATREFDTLFNNALAKRLDQQLSFAEEKSQGFHEFSQADALRLIQTLENPGEEIVAE